MYNMVLVPVAFEHEGEKIDQIKLARHLAGPNGKLRLLHILEDIPAMAMTYVPATISDDRRADAEKLINGLVESAGGNTEGEVIWGHVSRAIVERAKKIDADCIVIASHRPGFEDWFLGSTASDVVRHAPCSVHVIR